MKVKVKVKSCPTLCNPMDCSPPTSMVFSRQEYWSGLPFPSPGDLPNPGIKPGSPEFQVFKAKRLNEMAKVERRENVRFEP